MSTRNSLLLKSDLPGDSLSNWAVTIRLLKMAWEYRSWCTAMLLLQAILMASAVLLVQIGGLAIDVIRFHAGATELVPELPLGWTFPATWTPMTQASGERT